MSFLLVPHSLGLNLGSQHRSLGDRRLYDARDFADQITRLVFNPALNPLHTLVRAVHLQAESAAWHFVAHHPSIWKIGTSFTHRLRRNSDVFLVWPLHVNVFADLMDGQTKCYRPDVSHLWTLWLPNGRVEVSI